MSSLYDFNMKPDDIKIDRGISDIENIMKHLADQEKKAKKEAWLRENYGKLKRKEPHD